MMKGTTTDALSGTGSFSVTDGKVTCAGTYNSFDTSITISMKVTCSDGRLGIVVATRQNNGLDGSGHVTLNDGYTAEFLFGAPARAF